MIILFRFFRSEYYLKCVVGNDNKVTHKKLYSETCKEEKPYEIWSLLLLFHFCFLQYFCNTRSKEYWEKENL